MSEYQYYEFSAIDSPLTCKQQAELRSCSSRATINATSFVNEYHWGDLKAEPQDWIKKYFDIHIYSASWGSRRLILRLPKGSFNQEMLVEDSKSRSSVFETVKTPAHYIFDWSFDDDDGWYDEEGKGWLKKLQPLRDELQSGDCRSLYIGWLCRVYAGELSEDELEPFSPCGLGSLTMAQQALVEFLKLDEAWLVAASEDSSELAPPKPASLGFKAWYKAQPQDELETYLQLLFDGRAQEAEYRIRQAHSSWLTLNRRPEKALPRRSVSQIRDGLETARKQIEIREQKQARVEAAREKAEQEANYLELLKNVEIQREKIDEALQRGSGSGYDLALKLTQQLADAMKFAQRTQDFNDLLNRLLIRHGKRKAWVVRLQRAGLLGAGEHLAQ